MWVLDVTDHHVSVGLGCQCALGSWGQSVAASAMGKAGGGGPWPVVASRKAFSRRAPSSRRQAHRVVEMKRVSPHAFFPSGCHSCASPAKGVCARVRRLTLRPWQCICPGAQDPCLALARDAPRRYKQVVRQVSHSRPRPLRARLCVVCTSDCLSAQEARPRALSLSGPWDKIMRRASELVGTLCGQAAHRHGDLVSEAMAPVLSAW